MNSAAGPDEERQFSELFQTLNPQLGDNGFSNTVMRRIRRRARVRSAVLATAVLVGSLLAIGPISEVAISLSEGLTVIATRWDDANWLAQNRALVAVLLLSLAWPGVLRWLEQ